MMVPTHLVKVRHQQTEIWHSSDDLEEKKQNLFRLGFIQTEKIRRKPEFKQLIVIQLLNSAYFFTLLILWKF